MSPFGETLVRERGGPGSAAATGAVLAYPSEVSLADELITDERANSGEVYRARSDAEFVAKLEDCLKELDETAYRLESLTGSGIVPARGLAFLRDPTPDG